MSYLTYVEQNFERLTGVMPETEDAERIASVLDTVLADLSVCVTLHVYNFEVDTDGFSRYMDELRPSVNGAVYV